MAEIVEVTGNIFSSDCQVIVNTVNCVGVMGAGIALECKYRFREMFDRYAEICAVGQLEPGKLFLWAHSTPWVLNFPTKVHWKDDSSLDIIRSGLQKFAASYRTRRIGSIAFPRLGTSHGGLAWDRVRPLMYEILEPLHALRIEIYRFDPRSPDLLFPRLVSLADSLDEIGLARKLSLRTPQARALRVALDSGAVGNMVALQQADGVGVKTVERIYSVLCNAKHTETWNQLELF